MTPGLTGVILRTRPGSRGSPPGSSEIGRGANVLSGGESNWSRRYKANLEKLGSGDLVQVANLIGFDFDRDMLARARLILLQEG